MNILLGDNFHILVKLCDQNIYDPLILFSNIFIEIQTLIFEILINIYPNIQLIKT